MLGDKELAAKFDTLSSGVQRRIIKPALTEGAEYIKMYAQMLAVRCTGNMANTLYVSPREGKQRGVVSIQVSTGDRIVLGIPPRAKYYYPAAVEFGTDKMPARPFMRPAVYENEAIVMIKLGDALREAVEKRTAYK